VAFLQEEEGSACVRKATEAVALLCLPMDDPSDPVWLQPFNAAALLVPSALDSCFALLGRLSEGAAKRNSAGSRSADRSSSSSTVGRGSCSSRPLQCGGGSLTAAEQGLVRPSLYCAWETASQLPVCAAASHRRLGCALLRA
jgi:hypothetical protein